MNKTQTKIVILIVYYGNWPKWVQYFLHSCTNNPDLDFLIISDSDPCNCKYTNITFKKQSLDEICSLVQCKLGLRIASIDPYKLCDFKPTYGLLFEDFIDQYDYWGFSDVDLIFGQVQDLIFKRVSEGVDIILGYRSFVSGPFALFRNKKEINVLYQKAKDVDKILINKKYQGFDEHIVKPENRGLSLRKVFSVLCFFAKHPLLSFNFPLARFTFQWYYKKKNVTVPVDFTEVLYLLNDNQVKVCFDKFVLNYIDLVRSKYARKSIVYNGVGLKDFRGNGIAIYHFGILKGFDQFTQNIQPFDPSKEYMISEFGIQKNEI